MDGGLYRFVLDSYFVEGKKRMSQKRILYIEDNPDNRMLTKRILMVEGYEVLEAEDGPSGLAVAEKEDLDLIERVGRQQHRTQHRRFRIQVMRRHASRAQTH